MGFSGTIKQQRDVISLLEKLSQCSKKVSVPVDDSALAGDCKWLKKIRFIAN